MKLGKTLRRAALISSGVILTLTAVWAVAHEHGEEDWKVPEEAKKMKNPVDATPEALAAGRQIYIARCQNCHGEKGDSQGDEAKMLSVRPSDFTDTDMMEDMTDGELFWKITEGRRPMPGFKHKLSDEQRWQVVDYIRTLAPKPASSPAPSGSPNDAPQH